MSMLITDFFMTKKIGDHTNLLIRGCQGYQTVINNISKGFVAFTSALLFLFLFLLLTFFIIFLVFFSGLVFFSFYTNYKKNKFFLFQM